MRPLYAATLINAVDIIDPLTCTKYTKRLRIQIGRVQEGKTDHDYFRLAVQDGRHLLHVLRDMCIQSTRQTEEQTFSFLKGIPRFNTSQTSASLLNFRLLRGTLRSVLSSNQMIQLTENTTINSDKIDLTHPWISIEGVTNTACCSSRSVATTIEQPASYLSVPYASSFFLSSLQQINAYRETRGAASSDPTRSQRRDVATLGTVIMDSISAAASYYKASLTWKKQSYSKLAQESIAVFESKGLIQNQPFSARETSPIATLIKGFWASVHSSEHNLKRRSPPAQCSFTQVHDALNLYKRSTNYKILQYILHHFILSSEQSNRVSESAVSSQAKNVYTDALNIFKDSPSSSQAHYPYLENLLPYQRGPLIYLISAHILSCDSVVLLSPNKIGSIRGIISPYIEHFDKIDKCKNILQMASAFSRDSKLPVWQHTDECFLIYTPDAKVKRVVSALNDTLGSFSHVSLSMQALTTINIDPIQSPEKTAHGVQVFTYTKGKMSKFAPMLQPGQKTEFTISLFPDASKNNKQFRKLYQLDQANRRVSILVVSYESLQLSASYVADRISTFCVDNTLTTVFVHRRSREFTDIPLPSTACTMKFTILSLSEVLGIRESFSLNDGSQDAGTDVSKADTSIEISTRDSTFDRCSCTPRKSDPLYANELATLGASLIDCFNNEDLRDSIHQSDMLKDDISLMHDIKETLTNFTYPLTESDICAQSRNIPKVIMLPLQNSFSHTSQHAYIRQYDNINIRVMMDLFISSVRKLCGFPGSQMRNAVTLSPHLLENPIFRTITDNSWLPLPDSASTQANIHSFLSKFSHEVSAKGCNIDEVITRLDRTRISFLSDENYFGKGSLKFYYTLLNSRDKTDTLSRNSKNHVSVPQGYFLGNSSAEFATSAVLHNKFLKVGILKNLIEALAYNIKDSSTIHITNIVSNTSCTSLSETLMTHIQTLSAQYSALDYLILPDYLLDEYYISLIGQGSSNDSVYFSRNGLPITNYCTKVVSCLTRIVLASTLANPFIAGCANVSALKPHKVTLLNNALVIEPRAGSLVKLKCRYRPLISWRYASDTFTPLCYAGRSEQLLRFLQKSDKVLLNRHLSNIVDLYSHRLLNDNLIDDSISPTISFLNYLAHSNVVVSPNERSALSLQTLSEAATNSRIPKFICNSFIGQASHFETTVSTVLFSLVQTQVDVITNSFCSPLVRSINSLYNSSAELISLVSTIQANIASAMAARTLTEPSSYVAIIAVGSEEIKQTIYSVLRFSLTSLDVEVLVTDDGTIASLFQKRRKQHTICVFTQEEFCAGASDLRFMQLRDLFILPCCSNSAVFDSLSDANQPHTFTTYYFGNTMPSESPPLHITALSPPSSVEAVNTALYALVHTIKACGFSIKPLYIDSLASKSLSIPSVSHEIAGKNDSALIESFHKKIFEYCVRRYRRQSAKECMIQEPSTSSCYGDEPTPWFGLQPLSLVKLAVSLSYLFSGKYTTVGNSRYYSSHLPKFEQMYKEATLRELKTALSLSNESSSTDAPALVLTSSLHSFDFYSSDKSLTALPANKMQRGRQAQSFLSRYQGIQNKILEKFAVLSDLVFGNLSNGASDEFRSGCQFYMSYGCVLNPIHIRRRLIPTCERIYNFDIQMPLRPDSITMNGVPYNGCFGYGMFSMLRNLYSDITGRTYSLEHIWRSSKLLTRDKATANNVTSRLSRLTHGLIYCIDENLQLKEAESSKIRSFMLRIVNDSNSQLRAPGLIDATNSQPIKYQLKNYRLYMMNFADTWNVAPLQLTSLEAFRANLYSKTDDQMIGWRFRALLELVRPEVKEDIVELMCDYVLTYVPRILQFYVASSPIAYWFMLIMLVFSMDVSSDIVHSSNSCLGAPFSKSFSFASTLALTNKCSTPDTKIEEQFSQQNDVSLTEFIVVSPVSLNEKRMHSDLLSKRTQERGNRRHTQLLKNVVTKTDLWSELW